MNLTIPLPTYRSHKLVQALKIKAVIPNPRGFELHFDDERFCPIEVAEDWVRRLLPSDAGYSYLVGGYIVFYRDGFKSWSPAAAFEEGYTLVEPNEHRMTFGQALELLKAGHRVARAGWNGKGMWLAYSPGSKALPAEKFWAGPNRAYAESNGGTADVLPCITMKTATGEVLMGWLASQSDMLAWDWCMVGGDA